MPRISEYSTNISLNFKNRILEIIDDSGYSKREFATKVGVNKEVIIRATIYGIIPSVKSLMKIADSLELPISYLLGESDERDFYPLEEKSDFYTRIDNLLLEKNEKYIDMANSMPFQKNSYYEWKRTKSLPTLDYLKAIANYFNVSIDYLLGRTDER